MITFYNLTNNSDFMEAVGGLLSGKSTFIHLCWAWELVRRNFKVGPPDFIVIDSDPADPSSPGGGELLLLIRNITGDFPRRIQIIVFGPKELALPLRENPAVIFVNRDKGRGELLRKITEVIRYTNADEA